MQDNDMIMAIAGLLHDIGKFAQRAGVGGTRTWDYQAEQDFKYRHAMLTYDFIGTYLPTQWAAAVKPLAANHHRPLNPEERLIRLADQLSAGERASQGERGVDERHTHPKQLQSIFCSITSEGKRTTESLYLPLKPLEMKGDVIFPDKAWDEQRVWDTYEKLWQAFCSEAIELKAVHEPEGDLQTYLENMLMLLQRYTWCIPSAYFKSIPDISLYDHGRMTAALAVCLPATDPSSDIDDSNNPSSGAPVALLIGGDISGVQNFIYTITSRGATSALRGRSLYLELLTVAIARYLLRLMNLPVTNLIQVGGGHFYLLARPSNADQFEQIKQQITKKLLAFHRGDLYLALDYIPLFVSDFQGVALSHKWSALSDQLRKVKSQKFSELGPDIYSQVFEPKFDKGNQELECLVCGREHEETSQASHKCPQCLGFENLGDLLRQARFLRLSQSDIITQPEIVTAPGDWIASLNSFGIIAELFDKIPEQQKNSTCSVLYALHDSAIKELHPDRYIAVGRRFLVNVTPIITKEEREQLLESGDFEGNSLPSPGSVKPFEVMEYQSRSGFKRLGVMRLDLDNAGKLFSQGFGEYATFSRLASLSFMISLFFDGWVAEVAHKYNRQGGSSVDRVYSIYSGGDDLFFVGSWDTIPELAIDIRQDLLRFTAFHPGIHVSAGIVLIGGKYPLYQAADDAKEALKDAKALDGKNAITFLEQSLPWHIFASQVRPAVGDLHNWVTEQGVSRNLLQRLQQFQMLYLNKSKQMKDRGEAYNKVGNEPVFWGPWNWRAAYFLKRLATRTKLEKEIDALREDLGGEKFRAIEWIGLAARWADLLTR